MRHKPTNAVLVDMWTRRYGLSFRTNTATTGSGAYPSHCNDYSIVYFAFNWFGNWQYLNCTEIPKRHCTLLTFKMRSHKRSSTKFQVNDGKGWVVKISSLENLNIVQLFSISIPLPATGDKRVPGECAISVRQFNCFGKFFSCFRFGSTCWRINYDLWLIRNYFRTVDTTVGTVCREFSKICSVVKEPLVAKLFTWNEDHLRLE